MDNAPFDSYDAGSNLGLKESYRRIIMTADQIDYAGYMHRSLIGVVQELLASTAQANNGRGAITFLADFSNFSFYNGCTNEYVLTGPGSYLHGVLRFDDTNGAHFVNKSSGQVTAYGVWSGTEYKVNIKDDAVPLANLVNIANFQGDHGMIAIVNNLTIVQPSDPSTGVFRGRVVIVITFEDGVPTPRVQSFTGECSGQ